MDGDKCIIIPCEIFYFGKTGYKKWEYEVIINERNGAIEVRRKGNILIAQKDTSAKSNELPIHSFLIRDKNGKIQEKVVKGGVLHSYL